MGEIAEDIEEQLLERHHCTMLQVDESTDIENKATMLVFVQYIFFSEECARGYVMCTFVANQHHRFRLINLCCYMHEESSCRDWTVFWFLSVQFSSVT